MKQSALQKLGEDVLSELRTQLPATTFPRKRRRVRLSEVEQFGIHNVVLPVKSIAKEIAVVIKSAKWDRSVPPEPLPQFENCIIVADSTLGLSLRLLRAWTPQGMLTRLDFLLVPAR